MKREVSETENCFYGRKAVRVFFVLVILLSAGIETAYCLGAPEWLVAVLMWMPALSAVVAAIVSIKEKKERVTAKKLFSGIGIKKCRIRYVLLGVLIPLVYLLIPYMVYWHLHPDGFAYHGVAFSLIMKDLALYTIVSVLMGLVTATGEELGWRGFMLPALLERTGLKKALLFTCLFWCLWHFPLLIWGGYMDDTVLWYRLLAFVLCIFPVGVIAGLLTLRSGSVWPAAFLHAAHNAYDQSVFGVITRGDDLMYYVSETGILTIICAWIIAAVLYFTWFKERNRE